VNIQVQTANLEDGMPSVSQALTRLTTELGKAKGRDLKVLKIIHGYGSSGVGGDLRIAIQSTLRQMVQRGDISMCIYGENWRSSDDDAWNLVKRFPSLKHDSDFGRNNKGITLVVF
jgi:hypothetical protein